VRNHHHDQEVTHLEFEAYEPMAIGEMNKLITNAFERWKISKVYLAHRTGTVGVGELPVVIAVSSPHRKAGFSACQYLIDSLKATVPIWKKEHYLNGSVWVSATP
jgi:molybdopterin synthase catalytic subunit